MWFVFFGDRVSLKGLCRVAEGELRFRVKCLFTVCICGIRGSKCKMCKAKVATGSLEPRPSGWFQALRTRNMTGQNK